MAFVRSPFETACAAIELDRISNGRFTLGLGTAPQTWTEDFFGQEFLPPISRIREVIEILRLVFDSASENAESIPAIAVSITSYRSLASTLTLGLK